jgi:intein-encoded DNA endonuclease-like protein
MGYYGKLEEKLKARKLRKQGLSYKEIIEKVKVSKDTISRWCRDIKLTDKQLLRLYEKKKSAGLRGCIIGAKKQQEKRELLTKQLFQQGIEEIGKLSKRERFIIGVALYAGEGTKTDRRCEFANSDPRLIKFMSNWFKEFCGFSLIKFRGAIWLHEGLNEKIKLNYFGRI